MWAAGRASTASPVARSFLSIPSVRTGKCLWVCLFVLWFCLFVFQRCDSCRDLVNGLTRCLSHSTVRKKYFFPFQSPWIVARGFVSLFFVFYFFQVYILQRMKWVELRGFQISNTFLGFVFVLVFFPIVFTVIRFSSLCCSERS